MRTITLTCMTLAIAGCAQAPHYQTAHATQEIIALQTLDHEAPVNNDGITRELQGDYGKHAADNYRDSVYTNKEGRRVETQGDKGNK
ncbi:hypothetical protein OCL06_09710 [Alteromonas sp. ASW11-19]|uniref:Lipoprotein n=1 Tax=Alteromonas salexigens TaxID=2982530 RepID=A0ABT2VP73_9ALTE|nr:hypothetical protein [Alteromonas salexigens]MCU7554874.1 hypothetical protein [Alteromonas salexigens]